MTKTASAAARGMTASRQGASRALLTRKALDRAAQTTAGQQPLEALFPVVPAAAGDDQSGVESVDIKESSGGVGCVGAADDVAPVDAGAQATMTGDVAPPTVLYDQQSLSQAEGKPAEGAAETSSGERPGDNPGPQPLAEVAQPPAPPSAERAADAPPAPAHPAVAWSADDETLFQSLSARRKAAGYQRRGRDVSGQLLKVGAIQPSANTVTATIVALVAERGQVERGALLDAMAAATFPHPKAKPADRAWSQGWVAGALRDGFLATADAVSEASR